MLLLVVMGLGLLCDKHGFGGKSGRAGDAGARREGRGAATSRPEAAEPATPEPVEPPSPRPHGGRQGQS